MLQLGALLDRKPSQLSGGQRQRVAIGRAIVRAIDVMPNGLTTSRYTARLRSELRGSKAGRGCAFCRCRRRNGRMVGRVHAADAAKRQGVNARTTVVEILQDSDNRGRRGHHRRLPYSAQALRRRRNGVLARDRATIKFGIRHQDWRCDGRHYDGPIDDPHQVVAPPARRASEYLNVYAVAAGRPLQDMHLFGPLMARERSPYALRADGSLCRSGRSIMPIISIRRWSASS